MYYDVLLIKRKVSVIIRLVILSNNSNLLYDNKMIKIKRMYGMRYIDLSNFTATARVKNVWTFNYNLTLTKCFIFNISILKRATFEIVRFTIIACAHFAHFYHYKITLKDTIFINKYLRSVFYFYIFINLI